MTDARREPVSDPGGMIAANPNFETDVLWDKAVGVCVGMDCQRVFISRERFDSVVVPAYRALADRLAECEKETARLKTEAFTARNLADMAAGLLETRDKQLTDAQATIARLEKSGTWPDIIAPAQYEDPAAGWEDAKLPDLRTVWSVARECGYAVGVHGSLKRDVDLIAAPWTDEAVGNAELIDRLCAALNATRIDGPERKPFGRRAVMLQIDGYYKPIDLSIVPRSTAEQQVARVREIATKAIDDEPEMPGEMPNELYQTVHELDREGLAEWCRIMVRATKRGITERLEHALRETGA